jgi:hypothetical protein
MNDLRSFAQLCKTFDLNSKDAEKIFFLLRSFALFYTGFHLDRRTAP